MNWKDAVRKLSIVEDVDELSSLVEIILVEFKTVIYSTALRFSRGNKDMAADIFQETFVRLIESRMRIHSPAAFPKFIKVVTMNVARDLLRRRAVEERAIEILKGEEFVREGRLAETRLFIQAYLNVLSPDQAQVLKGRYFMGESDVETGLRLEKTPKNVRVIRHRALNQLREAIKNDES